MTRVTVERSRNASPPRRPVVLALAVLGLLALVALASRARSPGGGGTRHAVSSDLLFEYGLLFTLAFGLLMMPFLVQAFWTARQQGVQQQRGNWMARVFVIMAVLSLVFAARFAFQLLHRGAPQGTRTNPTGPPRGGIGAGRHGKPGSGAAHAVRFDWAPVAVVGSLLLAGGLVASMVLVHRRRSLPASKESLAEELAYVLDDTLDDLRAEPDPRRAVIAAYARMERALAWFGLPRNAFEAPLEYLRRVLIELQAGAESVHRLTGLFERAKFSTHTIGPSLKDEAIEALVTVRDELRGYR